MGRSPTPYMRMQPVFRVDIEDTERAKTIGENAAPDVILKLLGDVFGHGSDFHLTLSLEGFPMPKRNRELDALQKENERLKKSLLQAEQIIALQKKLRRCMAKRTRTNPKRRFSDAGIGS
jgi:hypothetical protein